MELLGGRRQTGPPETFPLPPSAADFTTTKVTPAEHLNYAATWGTLSLATGALAIRAIRAAK